MAGGSGGLLAQVIGKGFNKQLNPSGETSLNLDSGKQVPTNAPAGKSPGAVNVASALLQGGQPYTRMNLETLPTLNLNQPTEKTMAAGGMVQPPMASYNPTFQSAYTPIASYGQTVMQPQQNVQQPIQQPLQQPVTQQQIQPMQQGLGTLINNTGVQQ
jgi:hypothetical protein